jgi:Glycosyl hydrolase family 71
MAGNRGRSPDEPLRNPGPIVRRESDPHCAALHAGYDCIVTTAREYASLRSNSRRTNRDIPEMPAPIDCHPVLSRRQLLRTAGLGVMAAALASQLHAEQPVLAGAAAGFPWDEVAASARDFVARESPEHVWPFERAGAAALEKSERKVFLHYFTPFPLSFDNKPVDDDFYRRQYLERAGENGKFAQVGGYLRERPLAPGALPGPHWQAVNAAIDVLRAQNLGADGFGVDLQELESGRYWDQATALFGAAAASRTSFKILIEPDGDILKAISAEQLVKSLVVLGQHPSAFRLADGRLLLAPFAPEQRPVAYWQAVLEGLDKAGVASALLPVFNDLRAHAQAFAPICYAMSEWGNRDPDSVEGDAAIEVWRKLAGPRAVWMEAIAPQDVRPKNSIFWESRNTELFRRCWMKAIREQARHAHVITWNDYSEATEIAPSSGTQFLFYDLSAYFISWFKLGQPPRILRDTIYYSHRRQLFEPGHPPRGDDKPLKLLGRGPVQNRVELVALLTRPATLEIRQGDTVQRSDAGAGLAVLQAPARLGRPMLRIVRDGKAALEKVSDWQIADHPAAEDPLYVGGSSNRPFVRSGDWHQG